MTCFDRSWLALSGIAVLVTSGAAGCANSVVTSSGNGTTGAAASTSSTSTGGNATGGGGGAGGAPLGQSCTLQTLASGLTYPSQIHAGSDAVYVLVADSGSEDLLRVPVTGGAAPTIVTDASGESVGATRIVTADAARIAWVDVNGGVDVMPAGGGPTTTLLAPSTSVNLSHLTLGGDALYAATQDGSILRLPLTGGGAETVYVGPPDTGVQALAVDGATLYFAQIEVNDPLWDNKVFSIPNTGGPTTVLAHFRSAGSSLARSAGTLFVANRGDVSGGPGGTGGVLQATLDGSAPPATLVWGLGVGADGVAADATGVYWSGGQVAFGAMAPAIWPGTISRISANGVWETIVPSVVADSIVVCGDGVCWPDAQAGTVTRAQCSAIVPVPTGSTPAPACATYCAAMGGCSRVACLETCAHRIAPPTDSQGATHVACLAPHLDPHTCEASGCDAEPSALAVSRAAPPPAKPFQEGGGDSNATASYCQASEQGPAGVELAVCDGNASTASCTCYIDATPIGTCSVPMSQMLNDLPCFDEPCCNGLLGNVNG